MISWVHTRRLWVTAWLMLMGHSFSVDAAAGSDDCEEPIPWEVSHTELHVGGPMILVVHCNHLDARTVEVLLNGELVGRLSELAEAAMEYDGDTGATRALFCLWKRRTIPEGASCAGAFPVLAQAGKMSLSLRGGGLVEAATDLQVSDIPSQSHAVLKLIYPCDDPGSLKTMTSDEREHFFRWPLFIGRLLTSGQPTLDEFTTPPQAEFRIINQHPDWRDLIPPLQLSYEARLAITRHNIEMERSNFQILDDEFSDTLREIAPKLQQVQSSSAYGRCVLQRDLGKVKETLRSLDVLKQARGE